MSKKFGFDKLQEQLLVFVAGEADWLCEERKVGDSEIEKLFFLALHFNVYFRGGEFDRILQCNDEEHEASRMRDAPSPYTSFFIRPQAQIGKHRVDFLIHALNPEKSTAEHRVWRRLVVECDGHDFHERTKEQAAGDRSRDRWLTSNDYDVFRFTGSELWKDPWGCAEQVINWGVKGWL